MYVILFLVSLRPIDFRKQLLQKTCLRWEIYFPQTVSFPIKFLFEISFAKKSKNLLFTKIVD